jgi:hypothetical protein
MYFMLNEIGVYSVSWLDVSFANKKTNKVGVTSFKSEQQQTALAL